jgi:hypothetical protein
MSLAVVLDGEDITNDTTNVQTKSTSPGGFAGVTFNLKRRLDRSQLSPFASCIVYDQENGDQVGGGRLLQPGRGESVWDVECQGEGLASMTDRNTPYALIDQSLDNWTRSNRTTKRLDFSVSEYPGNTSFDDPVLLMETTDGVAIATNDNVVISNKVAQLCNQFLASFGYRVRSGRNDTDWSVRPRAYDPTFTSFDSFTTTWATGTSSRVVKTVNGDIAAGRAIAAVMWAYSGSGVSTSASFWSAMRDPIIRMQLLDQTGTLRTTGYTNEYVMIDEAFIDVVARFCPRLDIANARVDPGFHQFDQLAWLDGITPNGVMDELFAQEPGFTWHVWEQNQNGKWATELIQLPTTPRYEATTADGFVAPQPTTEIFDRATITGKSPAGRDVNYRATAVVQALVDAGFSREDSIALGSEVWSTGNASAAGSQYLGQHAVAPNAGTLTIARPIYDNQTGRMVDPSNVRAGGLVRVQGVQPTPDSINPAGADGVTVFRIASVAYSQDSRLATAELDSYTLDQERAIAELFKRGRKR